MAHRLVPVANIPTFLGGQSECDIGVAKDRSVDGIEADMANTSLNDSKSSTPGKSGKKGKKGKKGK